MTGRLLDHRDYCLFTIGQALSMFGSSAAGIALPLLVLRVTASPLWVGLVQGIETGALALACLPAGPFADRVNRRRLLVACDTARALAAAAVAAAILLGGPPRWLLLVAAAALGVFTAPFNSAAAASVRQLVPTDLLRKAVSVNIARSQASTLVAPVVGALCYAVSPSLPFWLDAGSFLLSALTVAVLRTSIAPSASPRPANWTRSLGTGLRFVWSNGPVRGAILVNSGLGFLLEASCLVVLVVLATRHSGVSVGLAMAAVGAGALMGNLASAHVPARLAPSCLALGSITICCSLVLAMAFTHNPDVLTALLAGCAAAASVTRTTMVAVRTLLTPPELQGRLSSVVTLFSLTAPAAASSLAGFVLDQVPVNLIFLGLTGIAAGLVVATAVLRPAHVDRTPPDQAELPAPR